MREVRILALCPPRHTDPVSARLLRALAQPGLVGLQVEVCQVPYGFRTFSDAADSAPSPEARALLARAEEADAFITASREPEADGTEHPGTGPLLAALDRLTCYADPAGAPLAGKPAAVLTTSETDVVSPVPCTDIELLLLGTDCEIVGPRTVSSRVPEALWEQADGSLAISDPCVAMRLLLHLRRTERAVRSASPGRGDGFYG
ncbi:NAD(P)H-dependent oxidoreductase [Streptomyces sp. NPDC054796]